MRKKAPCGGHIGNKSRNVCWVICGQRFFVRVYESNESEAKTKHEDGKYNFSLGGEIIRKIRNYLSLLYQEECSITLEIVCRRYSMIWAKGKRVWFKFYKRTSSRLLELPIACSSRLTYTLICCIAASFIRTFLTIIFFLFSWKSIADKAKAVNKKIVR